MKINAIGVRCTHGKTFEINRPAGSGDYLFVLLKTPAYFFLDGEKVCAEPGSAILYQPGAPQVYTASGETYCNDFIHFNPEEDFAFLDALNIPMNRLINPLTQGVLSKIIADINLEYVSDNPHKKDSIDLLVKLLFIKLSEQISQCSVAEKFSKYYDGLLSLRSAIYSQPQKKWTVPDMADRLGLSPSYFQSIYKEAFHMTCIADVIQSKIEFAKYNLSQTRSSVREIASICGYENDVHFMRQFKKITGMTPREYRFKH
ncbi:MAG TPA: AraC family transcriptional regulator [Firmicutes bacterium]|nr:AraC family transcriptional regulator [Bacillota bacterium]